MCEACVVFVCRLLDGRPIYGGADGYDPDGLRTHGGTGGNLRYLPRGPLTTAQKIAWVNRWLPMTAAVMDLSRAIAAAQREPAFRA